MDLTLHDGSRYPFAASAAIVHHVAVPDVFLHEYEESKFPFEFLCVVERRIAEHEDAGGAQDQGYSSLSGCRCLLKVSNGFRQEFEVVGGGRFCASGEYFDGCACRRPCIDTLLGDCRMSSGHFLATIWQFCLLASC